MNKNKLKPIGEGSMADRNGYDFELLLGWLENISGEELDKASKNKKYSARADKLSDLVCGLQELLEND